MQTTPAGKYLYWLAILATLDELLRKNEEVLG
jgi:hypothetical protein